MSKYIKGLIQALTFVLLSNHVIGQTTLPCQVVTDNFNQEQLSQLDASEIQWLNFIATDSYSVQFSPEKAIGLEDIKQTDPDCTKDNINPFRIGSEPSDEHQYFRIGETGYVVIFYSSSRCQKLFQRKVTNQKSQEK